jgi:hypothetical protein
MAMLSLSAPMLRGFLVLTIAPPWFSNITFAAA